MRRSCDQLSMTWLIVLYLISLTMVEDFWMGCYTEKKLDLNCNLWERSVWTVFAGWKYFEGPVTSSAPPCLSGVIKTGKENSCVPVRVLSVVPGTVLVDTVHVSVTLKIVQLPLFYTLRTTRCCKCSYYYVMKFIHKTSSTTLLTYRCQYRTTQPNSI